MSETGNNRTSETDGPRALGTHLIVDLYDCSSEALDDLEGVRRAMIEAAEEMDATVVTDEFHRFEPHGISGTVVISESHLTIHSWPEHAFAAIDVFSCADHVDTDCAIEVVEGAFSPERIEVERLARGAEVVDRGPPAEEATGTAGSGAPET